MKKYVYPAVVYYDEDNAKYVMQIEELGLIAEGDTMEDAHEKLGMFLSQYLITSIMFDIEVSEPQEYSSVQSNNPNKTVILVEKLVDESKIKVF